MDNVVRVRYECVYLCKHMVWFLYAYVCSFVLFAKLFALLINLVKPCILGICILFGRRFCRGYHSRWGNEGFWLRGLFTHIHGVMFVCIRVLFCFVCQVICVVGQLGKNRAFEGIICFVWA